MTQALTKIEPLALPDANNPAQMASLPAWLVQRIDALVSVVQSDNQGKYRETVALPSGMMINSTQREKIESHISALTEFLSLDRPFTIRGKSLQNDQAIAVIVAGILLGPGARMDETTAETRTEGYLDAVEDLPAWTVREAIRKWHRAESAMLDKVPHDFRWPPAPGTLRRLALIERWKLQGRIVELRRVLDAEELIEYSDEHRAEMLQKLSTVVKLSA